MVVASHASSASAILKDVYRGPIRNTLNTKTVLKKRLQRNTTEFVGNRAVQSLETSYGVGQGARASGAKLPKRSEPSHLNTYIDIMNNYYRFSVGGVEMARTKGSKGAFAKLVNNRIESTVRNANQDQNRQLFGDGSGILCIGAGTETTGATGQTIYPYLHAPAGKYIRNRTGLSLQSLDFSDAATLVPASSDTDSDSLDVLATTTNTLFTWENGTWATPVAGDPLGIWRALKNGTSGTMYEMMGLFGICSDSDLIFDANYKYPGQNTSGGTSVNWKNPEGADYDYAVAAVSSNLQGIDAATYSFWRGYVDGNGGIPRGISQEILDKTSGEMRVSREADTTLCITTTGVRNAVARLWQNNRRFVNTMTLDGGFKAVDYDGMPLVEDKDCPRGTMFYLDESTLELHELDPFDWLTAGDGGVLHWITDYHAYEACLWSGMNLGTSDRGRNGMIVDIDETT